MNRIRMIGALSAAVTIPALLFAQIGCGGDNGPQTFTQFDRLARPAVNEVFASVAPPQGSPPGTPGRHQVNDLDNPTDDNGQLANDIGSFMTNTAGRSAAITAKVQQVLSPDVMIADLSVMNTAATYLGVETGGFTGGLFGGRALTDDVVDTSLAVIFGNAIPTITGVPDDNAEIPALTSDNVGPGAKHFSNVFPYLGPPV